MSAPQAKNRQDHFRGKIAVVTGGASGIGRSTAILLARRGAVVHVVDRRGDGARGVAAEIMAAGGTAFSHEVDVTDADAMLELADTIYAESGRCDILHNNAGIGLVGPVQDLELDDWRAVVEVNIMGVVHGVHAFVPRMLAQGGGGHIVNTASMLGLTVWPLFVPYTMSKHAIVGLTEALDAELSPQGIRVSAVCPGVTDTPIAHDAQLRGDLSTNADAAQFLSRFGTSPDKVGEAVVDAIVSNKLIRPVPRHQVYPTWILRRISPRAGSVLGRVVSGLAMRWAGGRTEREPAGVA